jgi:hypothetical protein
VGKNAAVSSGSNNDDAAGGQLDSSTPSLSLSLDETVMTWTGEYPCTFAQICQAI